MNELTITPAVTLRAKNPLNASGVYKITCVPTGEVYIGSSVLLRKRKTNHFRRLRLNEHHNAYLQNAYLKYGVSAFLFEVLEFVERRHLREREAVYLDQYDALYGLGFNLMVVTPKDDYSMTLTSGQRKGRSDSMKLRLQNPQFAEQVREGFRVAMQDSVYRATVINKMLETRKKNKQYGPITLQEYERRRSANRGRKFSQDVLERRSIALHIYHQSLTDEQKQQRALPCMREYIVTHPDGKEEQIKGLSAWCLKRGISQSNMVTVSNGKQAICTGYKCRPAHETAEQWQAKYDATPKRIRLSCPKSKNTQAFAGN